MLLIDRVATPIKDNLLDATIRLLQTLDNPSEAAILGVPIIDKIYFRKEI
ncbi:MAG: AraC family transcriptional regulator N-terminal domain-containing protein [Chloroflexota bacterium]